MISRPPSSSDDQQQHSRAACPICESSHLKRCPDGRDYLFGLAPGTFSISKCITCGCVFQNPLPDSSALAGFYPREYWWTEKSGKAAAGARLLDGLERSYREYVTAGHVGFLQECAREAPGSEKRLLDIGCGNGTFLHVARSRGFVPHGMDISSRAVEIAQTLYGLPVRQGEIGSKAWESFRFDYITMFHVLEHLPDPRIALNYARDLLQPSGRLILQVPNAASLQARAFGTRWYGLDVPRHVINFTPEALSRLLKETGFEFRLVSRFSLRDNPASIASSLVPWLDPIRRKGRGLDTNPLLSGVLELAYFGLFLLATPPAVVECALGRGGTIWVCARPR